MSFKLRFTSAGNNTKDGEEFVLVIKGQVTVYNEHYEPLTLHEGDSVYFDSRSGHCLTSTSEQDAEIVWICSNREALRHVDAE